MAKVKIADRVKETTTTAGVGAYTLAGAVTGFRPFSGAFAAGDVVPYCVEDGVNWEVGEGTLASGTPWTLSRTTVTASSNDGAAVNWLSGTKNVFCTVAARNTPTYEEGTWTPTISADNQGTLLVTYNMQTGYFTRVGRIVVASFSIETNSVSIGTASGDLRVAGLPYPGATANGFGMAYPIGLDFTTTSPLTTFLVQPTGETYVRFRQPGDDGVASSAPITGLSSGDKIYGSITYVI